MKKLLIVDDQAGIRMLLSEVFKNEGYDTILAANGIEAIRKLKEEEPDCLLMDLRMPGMDGKEVLQKIKTSYPDYPVVLMSAFSEEEMVRSVPGLRADHYFKKPFDIHEVRRVINHLLEES
ncbi:response regulator [Sporosarcina trichiuri]|nr:MULTISPECIES: response regulator [Sporosarcina]WJY26529.1 response regulator [Sporosarcina sp. 0.2-SM1T-5]